MKVSTGCFPMGSAASNYGERLGVCVSVYAVSQTKTKNTYKSDFDICFLSEESGLLAYRLFVSRIFRKHLRNVEK